jgi:acetylornithine/LysW-gamma-L-lysine aminotransferase
MGATLCSEQIASAAGKHGSTFGGNPLACAAALATIDYLIEHKLAQRAEQLGAAFVEKLNGNRPAIIREVRQLGLMIGIELKTKSRPYLEKLMEQGVLALPAGPTVIRLLPPLVIEEHKLMSACDTLIAVLDQSQAD